MNIVSTATPAVIRDRTRWSADGSYVLPPEARDTERFRYLDDLFVATGRVSPGWTSGARCRAIADWLGAIEPDELGRAAHAAWSRRQGTAYPWSVADRWEQKMQHDVRLTLERLFAEAGRADHAVVAYVCTTRE